MILTDKEFEVLEKLTEGFGFGKLQDIITLKKHLEKHEYTIDDVECYVQWKKDAILKAQEEQMKKHKEKVKPSKDALTKVLPKCPQCNALLEIIPVRVKEGRQNVHGYKSVLRCFNGDCVYEKYGREPALDIVKGLVGAVHAKILGYGE